MKKQSLFTAIFLPVFIWCNAAADNKTSMSYIETHKHLAIFEMYRSKIPASITLGQALLESNSGTSKLSLESNNHFGIKCKDEWTGEKYYHKDDDKNSQGEIIPSCFRVYGSVEESYADHSDFLSGRRYYAALFNLGMDYKKWAQGLKACGYATDSVYAEKLITIIEKFQLYQYDMAELPAPTVPVIMDFEPPKIDKPARPKEDKQTKWESKIDSWFTNDVGKPGQMPEAVNDEVSGSLKPDENFETQEVFGKPAAPTRIGSTNVFQSLSHQPVIKKPERK